MATRRRMNAKLMPCPEALKHVFIVGIKIIWITLPKTAYNGHVHCTVLGKRYFLDSKPGNWNWIVGRIVPVFCAGELAPPYTWYRMCLRYSPNNYYLFLSSNLQREPMIRAERSIEVAIECSGLDCQKRRESHVGTIWGSLEERNILCKMIGMVVLTFFKDLALCWNFGWCSI